MKTTGKLLRLPAVLERLGCEKTLLYELIKAGEFPRPLKLGAKVSVWPDAEVQEFIDTRRAERDARASGGASARARPVGRNQRVTAVAAE